MFARKPYTKPPRPPLVRVENQRGVMGGGLRGLAIVKAEPVRNESYRRWAASLPCCVCKIEGYSQAAHPNQGRGLGQKASDLDVFPLCCTRPGHMGHHAEHDLLIDMTLTERRAAELVYIAQTQAIAKEAGRPEFA